MAVTSSTTELRDAITVPLTEIIDAIRLTLDHTPPELVADMMQAGTVITGGGALVPGLAARLSADIELPVFVADNPLHSVVLGAGAYLDAL